MGSDRKRGCDYTGSMVFAVDVREACRSIRTGKAVWTYGFVTELLRRSHIVYLCTDAPLPPQWERMLKEHSDRMRTITVSSGVFWHWRMARVISALPTLDIYVSPTSFLVPFLLGSKTAYVPVVHDLIAFMHEPHNWKAKLIERLTLSRVLKHAAMVCTVSSQVQRDLLMRFPSLSSDDVRVLFAGPSALQPPARSSHPRTIVHIGTLCPRKNQAKLIEAFSRLPRELRAMHPLVIIGARGWHDEEIIRAIQSSEFVQWKGYLPDGERDACLQDAKVFAYPSLYEGFGLPVLDAMRAGIPVLTTQRGSLREVAGEAAVFVDPDDVESIRDGLERLLTDSALLERLQKEGPAQAAMFSWGATVDRFLEAMREVSETA